MAVQQKGALAADRVPRIIQGGMGVSVSSWRLARAVSARGHLGVVSGTALDAVFARRLQAGDPEGHLRRALASFPWPDMAGRVLERYLVPGGLPNGRPYRPTPMPALPMSPEGVDLLIVANYAEVFLAKEGHDGPVGINYLAKIQLPTLPSLLGAMLAGVDVVLMGGGIPLVIPGLLDGLAAWEEVELRVTVEGDGQGRSLSHRLDPRALCPEPLPALHRPTFLGIIASSTLARTLVRRSSGYVDGFVVEDHTAGGHNAPPRRSARSGGRPGYGPADVPDLGAIAELGRPFWVAGGCASPDTLREAQASGARGIQVGTAFALCEESAILPDIKREVIRRYRRGELRVATDLAASPTGYPFKVVPVGDGDHRRRVCDLGYLRQSYWRPDGEVGYRCPAEPIERYLAKGGAIEETVGKRCLCNGLLATIGLGQVRPEGVEPPIVTAGEDFSFLPHVLPEDSTSYSAADVLDYLLG